MPIPFAAYEAAHPRNDFLTKYDGGSDRANWDAQQSKVTLTPAQIALLQSFKREMPVLILAGAWCGDCAFQCGVLEAIAAHTPALKTRYADRDERADLQRELVMNGGNRVPIAVFYSEDGHEVARFGEKTLSEYRRKVRGLVPDAVLPVAGDRYAEAVADWLHEIERVQWVLRVSPRLRKLHQD